MNGPPVFPSSNPSSPLPPKPAWQPASAANSRRATPVVGRRLWLTRDDEPHGGEPGSGDAGFDALTDLFLGEVNRPRRAQPDAHGLSPRSDSTEPVGRLPVLRLAVDEPQDVAAQASPPPAEDRPGRDASARPVQPAFVECVVVGNLPVLASAWAAQYVREVARASQRPVAYLRVQAGFVTVELVGGAPDREGVPAPVLPPVADLGAALRLAATMTGRWVVRVDHADEATVAARQSVQLVTLITGADEAARVQAYGSLKELAERLPGTDEIRGPVVRVAIMSAAEAAAEQAGRRVAETVRQFLGRDVELAVCSARIRASRSAELLFNGRVDLPTTEILQQLELVLHETTAAEGSPPAAPTRDAPEQPSPIRSDAGPAGARPNADDPILPTPATEEATGATSSEVRSPTGSQVEPESRPGPFGAPPSPAVQVGATADAPDLADFLTGVTPLEARCPYAPDVRLGLGADGAVHLLAATDPSVGDEPAVLSLLVASSWVETHAPLLGAMTSRTVGRTRVLHLFTPSPKASRRLLDTEVRVHAISRLTVGGTVGWCCLELN